MLFAYCSMVVVVAVDGKFTALFTEHEHKWFVEEVMGWTDFDEFIAMMRRASNRQRK